jgi:type VI secretion system protein ImpL
MSAQAGGSVNMRWTVGAAAWAALSAVAWFAGDAILVAGQRPLDGPLARLAFIALLAALWLGWELWRVRKSLVDNQRLLDGLVRGVTDGDSAERASHELAVLQKRFEDAVDVLRRTRFRRPGGERRTVAELPWYMFIGAPGSGKTTALVNAGLRFPLGDPRGGEVLQGVGGTRNCDWWFTDEAVLLDTAGRYTTQDSDREADATAWLGFLDLLKRFRPRQPLNGALVTLSISDLVHWTDSELERYAGHVRERLKELHERLGVRIPAYVLVTKTDLLAGFNEFFSDFDAERRAQVWGVTFEATRLRGDARATAARFEEEFATLERRLYGVLLARLQDERDLQRRAAIYRFPQQFRSSGPLVARFLEAMLNGWSGAPLLLRGVYFTSGTQEGSPIDRVLGTLARNFNLERKVQPPAPGTGKSFFLKRLLREVIFAEAGLAGVDAAQERRRRLSLAAGVAALAASSAVIAALWTTSYFENRALVTASGARASALKLELAAQAAFHTGDEGRMLAALDRLRDLRAELDPEAALVHMGLGQGAKLGAQGERAYRNALREALMPHALSSLERALRVAPTREALEAYVSLFDNGRPDAGAMARALTAIWSLPESARPNLATHLRAALGYGPLALPRGRDEALVHAARATLGAATRL